MLPILLASLPLIPLTATHVNAASFPAQDNSAGDAGKHSCPKKLSGSESDSMPLPPGALARLDARGGTLHNANAEYTVTQVTVLVTRGGKLIPASSETGREYDLPLAVKPNSTGSLSMLLPSDHTREYSWKITKACGYRVK